VVCMSCGQLPHWVQWVPGVGPGRGRGVPWLGSTGPVLPVWYVQWLGGGWGWVSLGPTAGPRPMSRLPIGGGGGVVGAGIPAWPLAHARGPWYCCQVVGGAGPGRVCLAIAKPPTVVQLIGSGARLMPPAWFVICFTREAGRCLVCHRIVGDGLFGPLEMSLAAWSRTRARSLFANAAKCNARRLERTRAPTTTSTAHAARVRVQPRSTRGNARSVMNVDESRGVRCRKERRRGRGRSVCSAGAVPRSSSKAENAAQRARGAKKSPIGACRSSA